MPELPQRPISISTPRFNYRVAPGNSMGYQSSQISVTVFDNDLYEKNLKIPSFPTFGSAASDQLIAKQLATTSYLVAPLNDLKLTREVTNGKLSDCFSEIKETPATSRHFNAHEIQVLEILNTMHKNARDEKTRNELAQIIKFTRQVALGKSFEELELEKKTIVLGQYHYKVDWDRFGILIQRQSTVLNAKKQPRLKIETFRPQSSISDKKDALKILSTLINVSQGEQKSYFMRILNQINNSQIVSNR